MKMTITNKNILISGASIAGPTLAYWLKRYGFEPDSHGSMVASPW
jgi:hypothetical protein